MAHNDCGTEDTITARIVLPISSNPDTTFQVSRTRAARLLLLQFVLLKTGKLTKGMKVYLHEPKPLVWANMNLNLEGGKYED